MTTLAFTLQTNQKLDTKRSWNEQCKRLATQLSARKIMGRNIFGVEEAIKYFEVDPTESQLAVFSTIPFTEETLMECRNTHILVACFPLSVGDLRARTGHEHFASYTSRRISEIHLSNTICSGCPGTIASTIARWVGRNPRKVRTE